MVQHQRWNPIPAVMCGVASGAVAGGLLLGLAESVGGAWLPSGYKDIVAFIMIVAVLALRPQGLLGARQVRIR